MKVLITFAIAGLLLFSIPATQGTLLAGAQAPRNSTPQLQGRSSSASASRTTSLMVDEIRHQLVTLPYYGVFDWLEGEVLPDASVVLKGMVTRPTTKSDAEARVKKLEGVAKVVNQIEVLPLSTNDDRLRIDIYRAIFKYDSPLFQYATKAIPPIHIIMNNGRATLKGVVASEMDRQLAYTAARGVSGVFEVKNDLVVEKS